MTAGSEPLEPAAPAPAGGLAAAKAKASSVGLQVYLKAPQPVQEALLQGYLKTQPVVAKVAPHGRKLLLGSGVLLAARRLRHRSR